MIHANVEKWLNQVGFLKVSAAVVTHPGLLEASEEPRERRTGVMKGNLAMERIGVDR